jgi:polyisoprenoid-binding protein YceI
VTGLNGFSSEGGKGRATVIGTLSLNGHSRSITVPVEFEVGDPATVTGRFTIRMTEFGIEPPSLLFLKVRDPVQIDFTLHLARHQ